MIPRLARALAALLLCLTAAGCMVTVHLSSGTAAALMLVPVMVDDGAGRMNTGGGYYEARWFSDPDSHPAVRPKPAPAAPANARAEASSTP